MTAVPAPGRATPAPKAGAGTARTGDHWTSRAARRNLAYVGDIDFFFDSRNTAEAIHICVTHCDVLAECRAHAEQLAPLPFDCVMGGIAWGAHKPAARQPQPAGRCFLCRWRPS